MSQNKYIYETFEILPKYPKQKLAICQKCAIREDGSKTKRSFYEKFNVR